MCICLMCSLILRCSALLHYVRAPTGEAMDGSDAQLQKRIQLDPAINSPALG